MSNRLYVGNLSFNTGGDALRDAFAKFGEVTDGSSLDGRALRVSEAEERQGGGGKRARW
jgi:RNA recognition motif-containing protein